MLFSVPPALTQMAAARSNQKLGQLPPGSFGVVQDIFWFLWGTSQFETN